MEEKGLDKNTRGTGKTLENLLYRNPFKGLKGKVLVQTGPGSLQINRF
jgi:hypothetical protein